jgi:hypothetical protein
MSLIVSKKQIEIELTYDVPVEKNTELPILKLIELWFMSDKEE